MILKQDLFYSNFSQINILSKICVSFLFAFQTQEIILLDIVETFF